MRVSPMLCGHIDYTVSLLMRVCVYSYKYILRELDANVTVGRKSMFMHEHIIYTIGLDVHGGLRA